MSQTARVRCRLVALMISLINCNHRHTASAILVNRTIDDQFGDPITGTYPTYSPADGWQPGAGCSVCAVRPDVFKAFDGTWRDTTYHPGDAPRTVTVTFSGKLYFLRAQSVLYQGGAGMWKRDQHSFFFFRVPLDSPPPSPS